MASTKASDLRKEVIDIRSGRRLGDLIDVEIDEENGRITAIVVPGESKYFGLLGGGPDVVIPWSRIRRIGPDCILVELDNPMGPDRYGPVGPGQYGGPMGPGQ
ncbi:MAG: YlmC/YmxH family sporulation protein [Mycobacterium leprae]